MVAEDLEDMEMTDKTIEVMKAAMEKENQMKNKANMPDNNEQGEMDMQSNLNNQANSNNDELQNNTQEAKVSEAPSDEIAEEITPDMNNADNEDDDMAAETEEKQGKEKGFFKSSKSKELAAKEAMISELTDKLMRNMAEFDNFRKRTEKEKSMMFDLGVKSLLEKILPVVDNFERGLASVSEEDKNTAFVQGIELIYKQLMTVLDDIGLKPIEAVGKEFDPNLHNAVMHGEDENLGPNTVAEEFQKGYTYRDMVVRHSMVKVVN